MAKIKEAWTVTAENGAISFSGGATPTGEVRITILDSEGHTSTKLSAEEWREIVARVEGKLVQPYTGDPQR